MCKSTPAFSEQVLPMSAVARILNLRRSNLQHCTEQSRWLWVASIGTYTALYDIQCDECLH